MGDLRTLKLHISLIKGIGPAVYTRIERWLEHGAGDAAAVYHCSVQRLQQMGLSEEQAVKVHQGLADVAVLRREEELVQKHGVRLVMRGDPEYPAILSTIHLPPLVLYVQGSLEALSASAVAVVGSRDAQVYGRSVVEQFVPALVAMGQCVVSGGARGVDAFAHRSALASQGKTVAVLGSGLLRPYPAEHASLFAQIVASGGAVISPFPLQMTPLAANFPARNRIIAGLSRACIVVQAALRSGALITAASALQEGRDVGVVPGSIFDPLSAGCHRLLAEGATPLSSVEDVRLFLGMEKSAVPGEAPGRRSLGEVGSCEIGLMKADVDPIIRACERPCSFDELLHISALSNEQLHERLWHLQIEGSVEQTSTGLWRSV